MNEITYTLIADGSSDKVFLRIIKWCLDDLYPKLPTKEQYADFRTLRNPPRAGDVLGQIKYAEITTLLTFVFIIEMQKVMT